MSQINHQYEDRLNVLMRSYEEVPLWWYLVLFMCCFVTMITILAKGYLFIPIWTYFIALATGALAIVVSTMSSRFLLVLINRSRWDGSMPYRIFNW